MHNRKWACLLWRNPAPNVLKESLLILLPPPPARMPAHADVTQLLNAHQQGDAAASERVLPLVYDALRQIARNHLRGESADHTLDPSALVHEAYVRLVDVEQVTWQSRAHFFAMASRAMRRVLVDHARRHQAEKRRGEAVHVPTDDAPLAADLRPDEILALDEALERLELVDARKAKVVQLRFFGGFTHEETAELLGVSRATVRLDWTMARAWLRDALDAADDSDDR
jgi:RNA polymerase sigma factor (TIGR02999 family)